jgi:hypothetical protein
LFDMSPSTGPSRSHSSRAAVPPYSDQPSMYEPTVFTCWRGRAELVPVPGAAASRANGIIPRSFWNASSGSAGSVAIGALPPPSFARPNVWSMNWPQVHAHWLTPRSEKMFCPRSLKTLLLT